MSRARIHDKQYITAKEWKESFGGKRSGEGPSCLTHRASSRLLPLDHCALTLQRTQDPMISVPDGTVFDAASIVAHVRKHGSHPVTGAPLRERQLVRIHFHRSGGRQDAEVVCPVTGKTLNENTRVIAVKASGNVYSGEGATPQMLFGGADHAAWRDPLTEQQITKEDIVVIQDPNRVYNSKGKQEAARQRSRGRAVHDHRHDYDEDNNNNNNNKEQEEENINATGTMARILREVRERSKDEESTDGDGTRILYRSGSRPGAKSKAAAFTSTSMEIRTSRSEEDTDANQEIVRERLYKTVKKLGKPAFVTLHTNVGDLNLQLYAHMVPKTVDNFLSLCESGYYNNIIFHRLVKDFMIQGGDPTGTGKGGDSAWGHPFRDEFHPKLKHDAAGILSMANSGTHTNGSQFFLTFKECPHLDNKHSVFGKLVGGMSVLRKMEQTPTKTGTSQPEIDIQIIKTTVYSNPFHEAQAKKDAWQDEMRKKEEKTEQKRAAVAAGEASGYYYSQPLRKGTTTQATQHSGIGKYLPASALSSAGASKKRPMTGTVNDGTSSSANIKKKAKTTSGFDFSRW